MAIPTSVTDSLRVFVQEIYNKIPAMIDQRLAALGVTRAIRGGGVAAGSVTGTLPSGVTLPLHHTTHEVGGTDAFAGIVGGSAHAPAGLTGSVQASRYVGATASGTPTTGAHLLGDWVADQTGKRWTCTAAGTPGTWAQEPGTGFVNPMTTRGDIIVENATPAPARLALGIIGQRLASNGTDLVYVDDVLTIQAVIGNGVALPATTDEPFTFVCDFAATLMGWTLISKTSGSVTLDVKKSTYAGYAGSLTSMANAGTKPALASAVKAQDIVLTSWTTAIAAGDIMEVSVNVTAVTLTRCTLALKLKRA